MFMGIGTFLSYKYLRIHLITYEPVFRTTESHIVQPGTWLIMSSDPAHLYVIKALSASCLHFILVSMIAANPNLTDKNGLVFPSFVNKFLFFLVLWKEYFYNIISLLNRINWKDITRNHYN